MLSKHSYQNINFSNDKSKYCTIRTPDTIHPHKIIFLNSAHGHWLSYELHGEKDKILLAKVLSSKGAMLGFSSLRMLHFVFALHKQESGCTAQDGATLMYVALREFKCALTTDSS